MWELDCEESSAPKNWCFWTVVLEKILESPLDCKEIQPVHPLRDQSLLFIRMIKAETPILCPPHAKSWLILKYPDARKDWGQKEKGMTEDEMAGWHTDSMDMSVSELQELVMDREAWRPAIHGVAKSQTWLSNWTELTWLTWGVHLSMSYYFCLYILFMAFPRQEYWSGLPFPSPVGHILSDPSISHPFWLTLHGMALIFI